MQSRNSLQSAHRRCLQSSVVGICLLFCVTLGHGQQFLNADAIDFSPIYSKSDSFGIVPIKVKIRPVRVKSPVTIIYENINISCQVELVNPSVELPGDTTERGEIEHTLFLRVKNLTKPITGDELGKLYLSSDNKKESPLYLRMTERYMYNKQKSFWIEIGANFDLIDGLQANNFFAGVFLRTFDIRPLSPGKEKRLGIFAGVYEGKTLTAESDGNYGKFEYYNENSLALTSTSHPQKIKPNELGGFQDNAQIKTTIETRNMSLFFSPIYRLSRTSAKHDGIHFFLSGWVELQWQRNTQVREYSNLFRIDTISIAKDQLSNYQTLSPEQSKAQVSSTFDLRSHYFGLGLPVYFREHDTNLFINVVAGYSNQPQASTTPTAWLMAPLDRVWNWFYVIQFRLSEERYGISFTGEVRGLTIHNSPPFVSLALSKKFDLNKFLEFK